MKTSILLATAIAAFGAMPAAATILTFDVQGGVTDFKALAQSYGDNVTGSPDANGHSYGFGAEGTTPNVAVSYGTPGETPALWTTGYGDLTNVHFNDADGDLTFTTTFTADAGFLVDLYSFDIASFFTAGQTINGLTITDVATSTQLFSVGPTFVQGVAHDTFNFAANPLSGAQLRLVIDLTGLGGLSDDIGIDNVRFGQRLAATPAVPEPASWAMMIAGFGLVGGAMRRRVGEQRAIA
jgi:hypothetical protein